MVYDTELIANPRPDPHLRRIHDSFYGDELRLSLVLFRPGDVKYKPRLAVGARQTQNLTLINE